MTTSAWLPLRRAGERMFPGILFLLLLLAVYADPLFSHRNFGGRDLLGYHLPVEKAIHDAYSRGRLPVWIAEIAGGRPLLPNPNAGALYPLRALLSLLPFPTAMRLFPIFHWILAGLGMMQLASSFAVSRWGAWIAAVTYVFSGVGVSEVFYTNLQPGVALLPWIVWAVGRRPQASSGCDLLLATLLGLDFLAGDVFTISLALASALLWIAVETGQRDRGGVLGRFCVSLLLAALLAAPQILATLLWIPQTNRAVLGMKLAEALNFSISPWRLLEFLVPFPFGPVWQLESGQVWGWSVLRERPVGFFSTLYAGAFAPIALVMVWRSGRPGVRFARLLFLLGLAATMLPGFVPARWRDLSSPLPLRYPEKLAVAFVLALALCAGLAFDDWRDRRRPTRWVLGVGVVWAFLAALAFLAPEQSGWLATALTGTDSLLSPIAAKSLPVSLAEAGLLWMATALALTALCRPGFRFTAGVALLTLVPIAASRRIGRTFSEDDLFPPTAFTRFLERADPAHSFLVFGVELDPRMKASELPDVANIGLYRRTWIWYTHAFWRRGTVLNRDLDSGDLSRTESLRRIAHLALGYRDSGPFFGNLALRWSIRFRGQEPLPGYHRVGGDTVQDWDESEGAFPDIRLLMRWKEESGSTNALQVLSRLGAGEVVLETGVSRSGAAAPGRVRVIERSPERLLVETESVEPSWLFVLRAYWDYRRVLVDGRPVEAVPAQLAFSAVPIPAGSHKIDWLECVPGGEVSRFGPVLFALLAAAVAFRNSRARRSVG